MQQQLRAFVLDHKLKSEKKSVWILIKTPHCGNCIQEEVISIHVLHKTPASVYFYVDLGKFVDLIQLCCCDSYGSIHTKIYTEYTVYIFTATQFTTIEANLEFNI